MVQAGEAADVGNLMGLADLVDCMFSDDRVDGVLQTLTLGTFGLPFNLVGGAEDLRDEMRGIDGIGGEWECMHPEEELTQLYNWGVMLGMGLYYRRPQPRLYGQEQKYVLETWHPRFLQYDHYASTGSHWRVQTKSGVKQVIPGGPFGLFLPYGSKRPWNQGKWRRCAFPWLVKRFALEDRANQAEINGTPTLVGSSEQGGTEKQRQRFLGELERLGRNGRLVLPDGWKLDVVEAVGRTWEIFSESTDWADKAITISIASQVTTTEGSPGFDSGKTQDQILASVTRYFAKSFSRCLYYGSTVPYVEANGRPKKDAPCGMWNTERTSSQASLATTYETLGRAVPELDQALKRIGKRVNSEAIFSTFAIPIVDDDDADPMPDPAGRPSAPKPGAKPGPPQPSNLHDPVLP